MLEKKYRISKDKEYKKIFRKSKKFDTENLVFRVAKRNVTSTDLSHRKNTEDSNKLKPNAYGLNSRFGFVVSNKIDKRAARRNGLKRRLRAVIGENLDTIKPGFDVVIMVKKQPKYPYKYEEIKSEVLEGIRRCGLISS